MDETCFGIGYPTMLHRRTNYNFWFFIGKFWAQIHLEHDWSSVHHESHGIFFASLNFSHTTKIIIHSNESVSHCHLDQVHTIEKKNKNKNLSSLSTYLSLNIFSVSIWRLRASIDPLFFGNIYLAKSNFYT